MIISRWRVWSCEVIEQVIAENPADIDLKELKKRLSAAYPFGQRKYTPYKLWLNEVNKAIDRIRRHRHPWNAHLVQSDLFCEAN